MILEINIDGLISTDYALTAEQIENRLREAIQSCLKDCTIEDLHVNVAKNPK